MHNTHTSCIARQPDTAGNKRLRAFEMKLKLGLNVPNFDVSDIWLSSHKSYMFVYDDIAIVSVIKRPELCTRGRFFKISDTVVPIHIDNSNTNHSERWHF